VELDDNKVATALLELRIMLYAAAQRLKGEHLDEFKQLIREIAQVLDLDTKGAGLYPEAG